MIEILLALSLAAGEDSHQLQPIAVEALRMPGPASPIDAVRVISRAQIERSAARDLSELLNGVAGVDVVRSGPAGAQTSVFMRGTNSNHALVLVDGLRAGSTVTGAFAWEHLLLDQVERIEIIRGAAGHAHGSDAMGGVVNIITRRHESALSAGFGDRGWRQGDARLANGAWWVEASDRRSEGFSAQNRNGFSFDPDDDGHRVRAAGAGFGREWLGQTLTASLHLQEAMTEFDQGMSEQQSGRLQLALSGALSASVQHSLRVGVQSEELVTPDFFSRFESRRRELDWTLSGVGGEATTWHAGLSALAESGRSVDLYAMEDVFAADRDNQALFAGLRWQPGAYFAELNTRAEHNSEFGRHFSGRAGLGLALQPDTWLALSLGTAFRAPSLSEQRSPGFGGLFAGNPQLQPEEGRELQLRLSHDAEHFQWAATAFRSRIDNLIQFAGPDFQAINIARAGVVGAELEASTRWREWSLTAEATWQDPRDESSDAPLLRRPRHKLSLSASRDWGRWQGTVRALAIGTRQDFGGSLGGHTLLDLSLRRHLDSNLSLALGVHNALNHRYEPALGFNGAPRQVQVTVDYRP